jgi:prevent-host-death family protein
MKNKKTLSISEARKNIYDIAEDVQKPGVFYTITEKGAPKAVLLSAESFDNLLDDLDMYSDPGLMKRIKQAEEEYRRGDYLTWEELKKELGYVEQGPIMVRERGGNIYLKELGKKNKR